MKNESTVLVIISNEEIQQINVDVFEQQKYRVVVAGNSNEARLKYSNEKFDIVVIDMDMKGFNALEFVEIIRRKETLKNITDIIPILIIGEHADEFTLNFSNLDNIKYMAAPFTKLELKKKLLTFSGHSDIITSNTRKIVKGEYLITEGGTSHEMFWILAGKFLITKMNHDDKNVILGEIYPGELVGEMSFLDNLQGLRASRRSSIAKYLSFPIKNLLMLWRTNLAGLDR